MFFLFEYIHIVGHGKSRQSCKKNQQNTNEYYDKVKMHVLFKYLYLQNEQD
jgi:hypothetical protein